MESKIIAKLIVAFFFPIPVILSVFKDLKSRYLLLFVILFAVFVGLNISSEDTSDMYNYVTSSLQYENMPLGELFMEKDFFYPLLSKILNLISNDFYFITICFTIIFYFVFYKCIKVVADNLNPNYRSYLPWFYIIALYTVLPFTVVTAFRFTLAVLFFSWCLLEFSLNKNKKFLYFILLTPFIHFAFIMYIILPFVYLAISKFKFRTNIAITIFISSFIFANSGISGIANNLASQYLSESIADQTSDYASKDGLERNVERYATNVKEGSTKRAINRGITEYSRYILMFTLFFIILKRKKFLALNRFYENILVMALLSYSLTNFLTSILHGSRFFTVSNLYFYFGLFFLVSSTKMTLEQNKSFFYRNKFILNFISVVTIISFLNTAYISKGVFNFPNLIFGNWITSFFFLDY
jgi:hypothetical protein